MTVIKDDLLLYPYVCDLTLPDGTKVSLSDRTTGPGHIELEEILRSELDSLGKSLGVKIKDPAKCRVDTAGDESEGEEELAPDGVVGYRLRLASPQELSIEYLKARSLRALRRLDRVTLRENLTDRYKERIWLGLYIEEMPSLPIKTGGKALGTEYCWLRSLTLITILEEA